MPRKQKSRKPVASPDAVWVAPRPANSSEPRTFEPAEITRSNRYLEFADIALGTNEAARKKKNKRRGPAGHIELDQHPGGKVTHIDTARRSHPRGSQSFGAFRNPR